MTELEFPAVEPVSRAASEETYVRLRETPAEQIEERAARRLWRDPLLRRFLAVADIGAASVAVAGFALAGGPTAASAAVLIPAWIVLAKVFGLYHRDQRGLRHLTADELSSILMWSLTATTLTTFVLLVAGNHALALHVVGASWLAAAVSAVAFRSAARALWRHLTPAERTLIVGKGPLADAVRRKLEIFPDIHIELVGRCDALTVGRLRSDERFLADVERVILASATITEDLLTELLAVCRREKIKLSVVPPVRGMFGTAVQLTHVADLPLVAYNTWDVARSSLLLKHAFDFLVALAALVLLAPVLALIALGIRLSGPGPAIYAQTRVGKDGRQFRMFKFRTMVRDAEEQLTELVSLETLQEPMFKLRNDPRVTPIGGFLRRTSLDELPQLINVLKGEMSLVGPRPEQVELVERYRPEHRFRLAVKPGVTGPMQVFGRGELSFDERLAVEREYIENFSVARDLRIVALTLSAVFRGGGAY